MYWNETNSKGAWSAVGIENIYSNKRARITKGEASRKQLVRFALLKFIMKIQRKLI